MRQRNGNVHAAWRRRGSDAATDPAAAIFRELQNRELRDIDTCRRVWEQEADPLALCEAVRQCVDLPEWLGHALLAMLTDGDGNYPELRRKLWRQRSQHAIDATRAAEVAGVRTHPNLPQTWGRSFLIGQRFAEDTYSDMPRVSAAGTKRSYHRVRLGIWQHPGRYYRAREGMQTRIRQAWTYMLAVIKEQIESKK